jgi:hypothetical protein
MKMIKRRHQRIQMQNLIANLSDGVTSFPGTVSNISRLGMLLDDIPQKLRKSQGIKLSITVSAQGKDFKMQVEPKWVSGNEFPKMGLAIIDPPLDWTLFAMDCEPKDEDIWAATTHLPGF